MRIRIRIRSAAALVVPALVAGLLLIAPGDAWATRRPRRPAPPHPPGKQPTTQPQAPPTPSEANVQRAREHYERARSLFSAGNFNDALTEFLAAYEARPHPIVYLSIAECYERLDDFHHAVEYLDRYLRETPDAHDREQVLERMNRHRARPSKIRLVSEPPGGLIVVDGRETSQRTPSEIELTPGNHRIAVRKDGFRESTTDVQLEFAERRALTVALESTSMAPAPVGPTVERARGERPTMPLTTPTIIEEPGLEGRAGSTGGHGRVSPVAYVTGGLAAAALIGGGVLGVIVLQDLSAYKMNPTADLADQGERLAFFADVAFGVGAAAGLTTIVLILLSGSSSESATPSDGTISIGRDLHLVPAAGRRGGGLVLLGRF